MTREDLAQRIVALQDTMYRVSYSLLPNRYDQEDAVQEAVRVILQKVHTLREETYFKTWALRILINECHNVGRRKRREVPSEAILQDLPPDADHGVMEALMSLDAKLRLPIVLNVVEGYTIREIAQMLGVPESTVKSRMAKGRKLARDILTEEGALDHARTV